jgi:toxin ParE1/3/4
MKLLPYIISQRAIVDLENIWLYTVERWSIEQADRYYALIFDEIAFICSNTATGKSLEHIRKGYSSSKIKSHIIFYRILNNSTVEIIRILHERMDIENQLNS